MARSGWCWNHYAEGMPAMTHHTHYMIDQLLLEQGEYQPLEFLLQEGRLSYADYEAWRSGELDLLVNALFGDPEHIQQQLAQAEAYLQRRGWQAETIFYEPWRHNSSHPQTNAPTTPRPGPLCFSANNILNQCFHRRYRKPQDQPQLDLFTDAPATNLVNGITQALIDRNPSEARRQLERLHNTAPDNFRLGELERLVEASEGLTSAVKDAATDMQILQQTLTPLAENLLGKDSRNLLIPLWRRLSTALQNRPYLTAQPELHLSYTASQALDWDTARLAVEHEPHWQNNAILLLRHARACDHLRRQDAALQSWFTLCWRFPQQGDAIESSVYHELRQQWINFMELDPELPAQSFPAWMLLNKPGLTKLLPQPCDEPSACPSSFHTLYQLQRSRLHTHNKAHEQENTMILRARLKQQDFALYQYFLDKLGKLS